MEKIMKIIMITIVYIADILNVAGLKDLLHLIMGYTGVHPYPYIFSSAAAIAAAVAEEKVKSQYKYSGALLFIALEYVVYAAGLQLHAAVGLAVFKDEVAVMHLVTLYIYSRGVPLYKGVILNGGFSVAALAVLYS